MDREISAIILGLILVGAPISAPQAATVEFVYTRIADTDTPIPGGIGNFPGFGNDAPPAISGTSVVFRSGDGRVGTAVTTGVYRSSSGVLGAIADRTTPIPPIPTPPPTPPTFGSFGAPSPDGAEPAFTGNTTGGFSRGVYVGHGARTIVADTGTGVPGGSGAFTAFGANSSMDGGAVAFRGQSSAGNGIYSNAGGPLQVIADSGTPIPENAGMNFCPGCFGEPHLDSGAVVFSGGTNIDHGIYTNTGGSLRRIADRTTLVPDTNVSFSLFGRQPSIDDGSSVFWAAYPVGQGIFNETGGTLRVVADTGTAIPEGNGIFQTFGPAPAIDGRWIAFLGTATGQQGIYVAFGGMLAKVVDLEDTLDGKDIVALVFGREGLSQGRLVFQAAFADGSEGIYLASAVPLPGALWLFMLPLAGLAWFKAWSGRSRPSSL
jgi:hypothetical protein